MQIQNPLAGMIIREQAGLTLTEGYPSNLLPNVQGVIDMSPDLHASLESQAAISTSSGASTAYTTNSKRYFYLTGFSFGISKDATCDTATGSTSVTVVSNGVNYNIAFVPILTLTAQNQVISLNFNKHIRIDPASLVRFSNTSFTVGVFVRTILIFGYYRDY